MVIEQRHGRVGVIGCQHVESELAQPIGKLKLNQPVVFDHENNGRVKAFERHHQFVTIVGRFGSLE